MFKLMHTPDHLGWSKWSGIKIVQITYILIEPLLDSWGAQWLPRGVLSFFLHT